MKLSTKALTRAAAVAALYAAITLLLQPLSFGPLQMRASEALTLLPVLWPESVAGLFVGCFLSNLIGGYGLLDAVVGGGATLVAALLTRALRRSRGLAALPPVLVNAAAIGVMLHLVAEAPLWLTIAYVGVGQAVACYALGLPMLYALDKIGRLTN